MNIRNTLKLVSWMGNAQPVQPIITFISEKPSLVSMVFSGALGFDTYEWEYDDNASFFSSTSGTGNILSLVDYGVGEIFVRVKARNTTTNETTEYAYDTRLIEATQLRSLTISAQAGDGQVTIAHDVAADEPNVTTINVMRRVFNTGIYVEAGTFAPTTAPYIDNTVTNDVQYQYRLDIPSTIDFIGSNSNVATATPTAGIQTLSAPTGLLVTWDSVTGGSGTFSFIDTSAGNATGFPINIKDGATVVISTTLTAPTTSYAFSGLTVGVNYTFEVKATASGFNDSTISLINKVAINPNEDVIDMEADHGMTRYILPLDGRRFDDSLYGGVGTFEHPLSNIEPLTEAEYNTLTGEDYTLYPNGVSKITAVTNDGLGTILNNVFDNKVIDKTFVAIDAHLNGDLGEYIDEFKPNLIGPRYANVINYDIVNGSWICVDFLYNGGNAETPQPTLNAISYLGDDNTDKWKNVVDDWKILSRPTKIIGQPISRDGYVIQAYYIREFTPIPLNIAKDFYIGTTDNLPMRIKHGVEERYSGHIMHFGGETIWKDADRIFNATNYANKAISHNVEWISPHKSYLPTYRYMIQGSITTGMFLCVGNYTMREWDELHNGYGFDVEKLTWSMASGKASISGEFGGTGILNDVVNFGFNAHRRCDYSGVEVMGATGGSIRGAHYNVYDDVTANFNPQKRFAPPSQQMSVKFTTDFSNINNSGDIFDPSTHTDYLPSHAVETNDANFYINRFMGGNYRGTILHVDKYILPFNHPRCNQIDSYYNLCYNNNKVNKLPRSVTPRWNEPNAGKYTCSPTKALVEWEIPTSGKVITISRKPEYLVPQAGYNDAITGERAEKPIISYFAENGVVTHINWGLVFQKRSNQFTSDELAYISRVNRRPFVAQPDDTFKLLSWVDVNDVTGFEREQEVTIYDINNAVITTGIIHEIDNILFTNRIKIKGCTVNISDASTISNGETTANVTSANNYSPTQVYNFVRCQGAYYGYGGYGTGFAESDKQRIDGYVPWEWIVEPDLPTNITGAEGLNNSDTTNIIFEIEFVISQAEVLLDGQYREAVLTYKGQPKYGVNTLQFDINTTTKRITRKNSGWGGSYDGGPDERFTGLLTPYTWPGEGDPQGHAAYNRAELTWYLRMPIGWQNTPYRSILANAGNNSYLRPAGATAYPSSIVEADLDLTWNSKGITLVGEVAGFINIHRSEKPKSSRQFSRTNTIYEDNASYTPQYAIDEEMLPPNEVGRYIPKVRLYGATAINGNGATSYPNDIVTSNNVNDAPDLPKTVRDILIQIGEIE